MAQPQRSQSEQPEQFVQAMPTAHPELDDLALASALVRDAGCLAARMLADGLATEHKTSISDVVSAADRAAEELVVRRLRAERPRDGLVGEEGAAREASEPDGRTWFIDPVDGTYNFLSGLPYWCAAVALSTRTGLAGPDGRRRHHPLIGAVYHPFADELWLGGQSHPTTCNGNPVPQLQDIPLAHLSVASYLHPATLPDLGARDPLLAVLSGAATVRMLGSGSVELASVAAGRLGAWVQHDSLYWDWLPGVALVEAAGGAVDVVKHRGHRWHIAGNRLAVGGIRARLLGS